MRRVREDVQDLPAWPLGLLFVAYPVWWLAGFASFAVIGSALVMLILLIQRRRVEMPRGFPIWLVFLVFATGAAVELDSALRLVGFGVRIGNYLGATVVFLYVYNARARLDARKLFGYVACFFATVGVGGWLGVLFPHSSLPTPAEKVLPGAIRNNSYVSALVHPAFAELQQPYGSPVAFARPSAPFPYTNSWGCNMALLLPLVIAGVLMVGHTRRRTLYIGLIALASVPAAETLNRGMFLAIGIGLGYAALLYALRGRVGAFIAIVCVAVVGYAIALASGVAATLGARLQYSQSNEGRMEIYREAWDGAVQSPIFGNGAPRPSDVLDISVGTQGQMWNIMFSYGFPALICFVGFFVYAAVATIRSPGKGATWVHVVLVVAIVTFFYYGYDGPQLAVAMLAAGYGLRPRQMGNPAPVIVAERTLVRPLG